MQCIDKGVLMPMPKYREMLSSHGAAWGEAPAGDCHLELAAVMTDMIRFSAS